VCGLLFAGGAVRSSSPRFRKETVAA